MHDFEEIGKIKKVAKIAREALDLGHSAIKEGATTDDIDRMVHGYIIS